MVDRVFSRKAALALASVFALTVLVTGDSGRAMARVTGDAPHAQRQTAAKQSGGIVASITKSPVSPDGMVAGAKTDLVINLNVSMDPSVGGFLFLPGDTVPVALPDGFVRTGPEPFTAGGPACYNACNGVIMLQGWPQYPAVPFGGYAPSFDAATRTITMPISSNLGSPGGSPFVGVKQIHLLLTGFTNPTRPGKHRIELMVGRAGGGVESGWANADIRPHVDPSIHVTSAFAGDNNEIPPPLRLNPLYQSTVSGMRPVTLLLWDGAGSTFVGVSLEPKANGGYDLPPVFIPPGELVFRP
ncbi:MAG: hypothetical protein O2843_03570 [Chloroflexi bacterium]|nr:hypothetical protein [Chloroflexota bacterium]